MVVKPLHFITRGGAEHPARREVPRARISSHHLWPEYLPENLERLRVAAGVPSDP